MNRKYWLILLLLMLQACSGGSKDDAEENQEGTQKSEYENTTPLATDVTVLFNWNDPSDSGTTWFGWLWHDDVAYGNEGWTLDTGSDLGDGESTYFGIGPRSFDKGDYGDDNLVEIVTNERAPSTYEGGSFRVYDNPENTEAPNQATWWNFYDTKPLVERSITKEETDRMSFYIKLDGSKPINESGSPDSLGTNFHVGTYLCWYTGEAAHSTGDGCPREGPGNQHYYHYLTLNPGAWLHVELDDHPNHHRGKPGNTYHENSPVTKDDKGYFAQMSRFYMEIRAGQTEDTEYLLDEVEFYSTTDSHEINQNDESITSLWVGYWAEQDHWEIGFKDGANFSVGENKFSTFEIRWSILPITNDNYAEATTVEPQFYSGSKYVSESNPHFIRRASDYKRDVWTRFELPDDIEQNYEMVYFAIKDVSQPEVNKGSSWPWNRDDHGEAASPYIRTINYALKPPQS